MFKRIVVGIDGTSRGRDALALAVSLASATRAEVTLAHVYAPSSIELPIASAANRPLGEVAERLVTEAVRSGPPHARTAAIPGDHPADDLCRFAQKREADLLVIGGSRHAGIGRVLLGDTSRAIVRGAPCAVAVAPRDYGREGPRGHAASAAEGRELAGHGVSDH